MIIGNPTLITIWSRKLHIKLSLDTCSFLNCISIPIGNWQSMQLQLPKRCLRKGIGKGNGNGKRKLFFNYLFRTHVCLAFYLCARLSVCQPMLTQQQAPFYTLLTGNAKQESKRWVIGLIDTQLDSSSS